MHSTKAGIQACICTRDFISFSASWIIESDMRKSEKDFHFMDYESNYTFWQMFRIDFAFYFKKKWESFKKVNIIAVGLSAVLSVVIFQTNCIICWVLLLLLGCHYQDRLKKKCNEYWVLKHWSRVVENGVFINTPFSTNLLHCFTVSHGVWGNDQVCYEYWVFIPVLIGSISL